MTGESTRAVTAIAGTRRAVQLYPPAHPAYGEALEELESSVRAAAAGAPLVLNVHQGRLYHDSTVLPDDVPGLGQVVETFESLGLESVVFQPTFSARDAIGLTEILALRPSPELDVSAELAARGVSSVAVSLLARTDEEGEGSERDRLREQHRSLLRRSMLSIRAAMRQVSARDDGAIDEARAAARNLVSRLENDSAMVLAVATTRSGDDPAHSHALRVLVYALIIGAKLGLSTENLESLGAAALLHDTGKAAFDRNDLSQLERMAADHPRVGAEMLQRLAPVDVAPMLVAYEHHMCADGAGLPPRPEGYVAHPYSRMVAIADRFDNLVTPAAGTMALTPDRALVQVLREAGTKFDPFLARLFAGAMGPFPVGCVVRLSDQSVAIVSRFSTDPLRPVACLVFDAQGLDVTDPDAEDVDLSQSALRIVEVVSPVTLGIDVAEKLF